MHKINDKLNKNYKTRESRVLIPVVLKFRFNRQRNFPKPDPGKAYFRKNQYAGTIQLSELQELIIILENAGFVTRLVLKNC